MGQERFIIELYLNVEKKIDSYVFYHIENIYEQEISEIGLGDESLQLYIKLVREIFSEELSPQQCDNIIKLIYWCVLKQDLSLEKMCNIYKANYLHADNDYDRHVSQDDIEKALDLLSYKTPNTYCCSQCDHDFDFIPLSSSDITMIINLVQKLYFQENNSLKHICSTLDGVIPTSILQRAVDIINFNKLDYFERPEEIMAFSEQFEYLKSIVDDEGKRKYCDKHLFNSYRKYFIHSASDEVLSQDIKQAMLIIANMDFDYLFWKSMDAYKCMQNKEIKETVACYHNYYIQEQLMHNNNQEQLFNGLKYLENLYMLIKNSGDIFYI